MSIRLSSTVSIPRSSLKETFSRSSGPGGQNVNKVNSAVELRCDLNALGLDPDVRARAEKLAGHRLSADGVIVIHAHEFRKQGDNRDAARQRLAEILTKAARRPRTRRATKRPPVANEKRLQAKHIRAQVKRRRASRASED
jgi:ribosome-associated protein